MTRDFTLADRYEAESGEILLSGLQALVRLPLEAHRLDRADGLRTATMISGYEGSPLAGLDLELARRSELLAEHDVLHRPAVNEELGVTIVQGTQLAPQVGPLTHDGVLGIWYGKAPGLDRATDALRHGNLGGAHPRGGVVLLVGDDATAKSSTVPSASEAAMAEIGLVVLVPRDPQEILEFGLHAVRMSRFSGLWVGLKLATSVVDGSGIVRIAPPRPDRYRIPTSADGRAMGHDHEVSARFLQPRLADLERTLAARTDLAMRYTELNELNHITGDPGATIGFVAAGATFRNVVAALTDLGIDQENLERSGVRLLQLGVVHPLDGRAVGRFAEGLAEIVVVEEKRSFVESAVKDVLYDRAERPMVLGRRGPDGEPLLRTDGDLPPDVIAAAIAPRLAARLDLAAVRAWLARRERPRIHLPLVGAKRPPYFCSGCPHNRSTEAPAGTLVGAGIGCSGLVTIMDNDRIGDVVGFSQMGGEGMTWVGMAPFLRDPQPFVQNLGDGTYHHSGSLAVRAAVASGVTMTYKILLNGAVAMTGGQAVEGGRGIRDLIGNLVADGVRRVVVTTDDPRRYRGRALPGGVQVRHRDDLVAVQEELAGVPGVTVIVHEQECATELRRKRKRGKAATPGSRVHINTRVCEGCGDCGHKSNCLSVRPVDTEYGRKTQIDQHSCNMDFSCVLGDCPAFVSVVPGAPRDRAVADLPEHELPPPPAAPVPAVVTVRMLGVGGTGIVTAAQVLATAAARSGLQVSTLDQLGLAQKGGAVVSDLSFGTAVAESNLMGAEQCDVYIGCDLLVAADAANLAVTSPTRTVAVLSTGRLPTGPMVADPDVRYPEGERLAAAVVGRCREGESRTFDAQALAKGLLGSEQTANILMLGVAVQLGAIPLSPESLEAAIALNGAAVGQNVQAFRRGRQWVVDPGTVEALAGTAAPPPAVPTAAAVDVVVAAGLDPDGPAGTLIVDRVRELIAYQDVAYARHYATEVATVHRIAGGWGDDAPVTREFAHHLHRLMAYKDEFEVARLSLRPELAGEIEQTFGSGASHSFLLHPPVLRAIGMRRKIALGRPARPLLGLLAASRALRRYPAVNPFGWGRVRALERALPGEYRELVGAALATSDADDVEAVLEVVRAADLVRGYEAVKVAGVARFRERATEALAGLAEGRTAARG
ncbi:indolepyruvate ferredoxin oxidoreductase family protein [Pseudonocardia ailaonensis]|uniref:Indolepyruvate ferredoxin oxidoreductase family protein n=1 Tax=Pseudonocardia ailaonensis TaxID=367279 RepID=A0ABN2N0C0_9PSEU